MEILDTNFKCQILSFSTQVINSTWFIHKNSKQARILDVKCIWILKKSRSSLIYLLYYFLLLLPLFFLTCYWLSKTIWNNSANIQVNTSH